MKMTMQTPGRQITVQLPQWLENRLIKLFLAEAKRQDGKET